MNIVIKNERHKNKKQIKQAQQYHDRYLLESTGRCRAEPNFTSAGDILLSNVPMMTETNIERVLYKPNRCYICKEKYSHVHEFYHRLCPVCAKENYARRMQTHCLEGRRALVTGGRIKIGYEIALKLLRGGAEVMITTRFAKNAAQRYASEPDFTQWKHRLQIHALDLKHIQSVEGFCNYLLDEGKALDILINNAAQTIRKPDAYYVEMAQREQVSLGQKHQLLLNGFSDSLLEHSTKEYLAIAQSKQLTCHVKNDEFNEPVDMSASNSWVETLETVQTRELIEVQVVNAMAPFILNSRLKPLLCKSEHKQRFIVNVSAMEGQFNRKQKTHKHPHTNMAKAALNMMTRTSSMDYVKEGIFMTSVDTGWVTQENPFPIKIRGREKGMVPPLDCIDGAARVLAPIYDGLYGASPEYGVFLKDYRVVDW